MKAMLFVLAAIGLCLAQPRWVEMGPVPNPPSGRAVGDGAWLEPVTGASGLTIYAAKGNRTADFYAYSVAEDSWRVMAPVPLGTENKTVDEGSKGVYDGDEAIYVTKGNNSFGFYRFNTETGEWVQLPDVPAGPDSSRLRGGTDLVYVERGGTGHVYLLKGQSGEFYRFDVASQTWAALPHAPAGSEPQWGFGSWLAYDRVGSILAHKARVNELWVFDLAGDSWLAAPRIGMPSVGRSGQAIMSGAGGSAEWFEGKVYALKGNRTPEVWQYFVSGDSWRQLDDVPVVVDGGGALALGDSGPGGSRYFYALVGGSRSEFWRYRSGGVPAVSERGLGSLGRVSVVPSPLRAGRGVLHYSLSGSGVARLILCDPSGRRRLSQRVILPDSGRVPLPSGLGAGTYFLLVETGSRSSVLRVVVAR